MRDRIKWREFGCGIELTRSGREGPVPTASIVPLEPWLLLSDGTEVRSVQFAVGPRAGGGKWLVLFAGGAGVSVWIEKLVPQWTADAVLAAQFDLIRDLVGRRVRAAEVELVRPDWAETTWRQDLERARQRSPEWFGTGRMAVVDSAKDGGCRRPSIVTPVDHICRQPSLEPGERRRRRT